MSLSRSKYGRHTSQLQVNDRTHIPSISAVLKAIHCALINDFEAIFKINSTERSDEYTRIFQIFYANTEALLGNQKQSASKSSNSPSISNYLNLNQNPDFGEQIILITFMLLFDFNLDKMFLNNPIAINFSKDFQLIEVHIVEQLCDNEYSIVLKLLTFIHVLHTIKNQENSLQDDYKRRLTDLIRSEFSIFKVDAVDSNNNVRRTCIFNCFMILLAEISILINQYFQMQTF